MPPRLSARAIGLFVVLATIATACSSGGEEALVDAASDTTVTVVDSTAAPDPTTAATADDEASDDTASDDTEADDTAAPEDLAPFPPLGEQFAAVEVRGEPLDPMPSRIPVTEPENDPAIGQTAPEILGTDFAGMPVEILADGTPRIIMFVAHWCPHCQREVPAVLDLIASGALPDGLELVIVSTAVRDGDDKYPPQTWLQNEGWRGPIIRDSEEYDALLAFGAGGFPFSVYLNADHQVVTRSAGEIPSDVLEQLWLATASG